MFDDPCPDCDDYEFSGMGNGKCDKCHGTGIDNIIKTMMTLGSEECPRCDGDGVCPTCNGGGKG